MKRITKWKSFDFGPETSVDENMSPLKKRKSKSGSLDCTNLTSKTSKPMNALNKNNCNFNYNKIIEPKGVADLVVHSKKIQELEGWIKAVTNQTDRKRTDFLLLSGPTGSGKTAAVQVLCKLMNVDITEWTNPVDMEFDVFRGPGQMTKFLDFFSESKYTSLFSRGNVKKILLIKDFPNTLIRNPEEFSGVLEDISFKATHPVIFICTDSNSQDLNLQRSLFPEDILLKYSICHISFNPCAPTLLKKGLQRAVDILQAYPHMFHVPSQKTIDAILASSMGDIRCAMNQLYLASVIGSQDLPLVKSKIEKTGYKRKRNNLASTIKHMVKDETLGLFHGLGRVLHPKRRKEGGSWRLNCDIQKLVDQFSIQPSTFIAFLFENYLKYHAELNDVEKSTEVLSFATRLLDSWENHDTLVMALWVAVLGLMVFNEHKESKWNQIRGPKKMYKTRLNEDGPVQLHPTDRFYYNMITKSEKYHKFNCDF